LIARARVENRPRRIRDEIETSSDILDLRFKFTVPLPSRSIAMIDLIGTLVVGYLFKERQILVGGPSRRDRENYGARRGVARGAKVTRFFHRPCAAEPLANFFSRSTLVARALGEKRG